MSQPGQARLQPAIPPIAFPALLIGAIAVGASAIFVRLSELGPIPTAFYRPFLAIPALWLWVALQPAVVERRRQASARDFGLMLLGGAFFAGDLAFWHLSLHHTTVANATLFASSSSVFVVAAEWLIFRRAIGAGFLRGMALALAGGVCLAGGSFSISPENLVGDAYGIVTAMFLGAYLMTVARLRAVYSTATIMLWTSIGTSIVLFPIALATGEAMLATTLGGWTVLAALGLVSHAAGQGLIAYALAHLPAGVAAVGLLFEPVAAALLAVLILAEPITAWQTVGGAIILWGILIARRGYG